MKRLNRLLAATLALAFTSLTAHADKPFISVASTTSTANSGLFDYLLKKFTDEKGIDVRVIAVGTGQAVRLARKGDADVLFVHHRPSEEKFVADGFGKKRFDVMYNDFVLVGPKSDPAHIKGCSSPAEALSKIKASGASFASRGDDSGTHKREVSLWKAANITPDGYWYRATGSGMGATLNVASGINAYAISDRGTWISFKNKKDLTILCEGDKSLFNPYGVIAVNKDKFAHIKEKEANTFVNWLVSAKGQKLISDFRVNGQQLFKPNAQ
ncbi:Periplasmic binding protein [Candidatus Terasakiella magnetica]|uniref:Periplasmic binding protein n=1 Tax=Candidatus Terasakiella magnetica TaxID=1867952 RepID=A0A1C3RL16_9PROT|nr:substrate-binding domain-containing protein [Candidatus Terasakiella magnetica]SCA57964.1 Periplasmic binding protein [Candidatus Terasakiella magnetica]